MRRSTRTLVALVVVLVSIAGPAGASHAAVGASASHADAGETCQFPTSATDATGTNVTVTSEPERIVTLAPSAAQTVWEIGGAEKVVGVSQYAAYLDGASSRTNVSGSGSAWVDVETIVSLEPDLVLAPFVVPNETVEKLRRAGVTVYRFRSASTVDEIERKTLRTGELTGECAGARETVDWMEQRLEEVRRATEGTDRPRVLYTFHGYTAGEGTFVDTIITTAGGRNVAAMANVTGFKQLNSEVVVARDPQWILLNDGAVSIPETAAYNGTYAVQHNQTVVVREEYLSQPAPRMVYAITNLTRALYPEAYPQAVNETAANATSTADATSTAQSESASNRAPGFGVVAALLALTAAALLASRRP